MSDTGGYNPNASLLSANPGVDLKVFAGGARTGNGADAGTGADPNLSNIEGIANDDNTFNFVKHVLDIEYVIPGGTEASSERETYELLNGLTTFGAIKNLTATELQSISTFLNTHDEKYKDFMSQKKPAQPQ
jgi:hypothetical protein